MNLKNIFKKTEQNKKKDPYTQERKTKKTNPTQTKQTNKKKTTPKNISFQTKTFSWVFLGGFF